jgi:non-heme chloroperoxidase
MAEPNSPQSVNVNGCDLAYITQGSGDAVIFVHGSVNDYRSWRNQMSPFADRYQAVAYSRRHHWPNAQPSEGATYEIERHVADLGALIETLDLAPARLVGSSYGAMTALTLALARPELVRNLVLGEPPLFHWLPALPEGGVLLDEFMANAFGPARQAFVQGEPETGVRLFINGVIGPGAFDRMPDAAREMMLDNADTMRTETTTPLEMYFPRFSPEDVQGLPVPVLLVEGKVSPRIFGIVTDELGRVLPEAERVTISAASHGMHAQNPTEYNEAVLAFQTRN